MLCRELIAVSTQIHTKLINTLCGAECGILSIKLLVNILTTGL